MKQYQHHSGETPDVSWRVVRIACEPGFEDSISTIIFESGFSGLEEHTESGHPVYTAYYPVTFQIPAPPENLQISLQELSTKTSKMPGHILSVDDVPVEDWETSWREGLGAVEVGSRLVVHPSWITYNNKDNRCEIIIDPRMAFGTGSHATTYLCLEFLDTIEMNGLSVIDAGCGSGVLSIAAAKLGARSVYGFDRDPFSVRNALENLKINGADETVIIEEAELETVQAQPCDLVLANIISGVLISNLPVLRSFLKPGGNIIFSGLLAEEETRFAESLKKEGFSLLRVAKRDEWIAVQAGI